MALTSEDGTGLQGARSYASLAQIDAYWLARPHASLSGTWTAAPLAQKEGAATEASAYLDATYGIRWKGLKRTSTQGLHWPRSEAMDEAGYPLPDLPRELVDATAELAARALSARLIPDVAEGQVVTSKTEKVGDLEERTTYGEGTRLAATFGPVSGLVAPLLRHGLGWSFR